MASTLKESIVKEALEKLSWDGLHAHLVDLDTDEVANQLFDIIRKSDTLILRRHSPGQEKKREEFLQGLSGYIETTAVLRANRRGALCAADHATGIIQQLDRTFPRGGCPLHN